MKTNSMNRWVSSWASLCQPWCCLLIALIWPWCCPLIYLLISSMFLNWPTNLITKSTHHFAMETHKSVFVDRLLQMSNHQISVINVTYLKIIVVQPYWISPLILVIDWSLPPSSMAFLKRNQLVFSDEHESSDFNPTARDPPLFICPAV